jgi:hypothetical protein
MWQAKQVTGGPPIQSLRFYLEAPVISQVTVILWAVNSAVGAVLLVLLAVRKNYREFPAFSGYVMLNLALGVLAFFIYHRWGFSSRLSWQLAWGMQGAVICARALAVAEVCRGMLGRYRGIWALAWRVLLGCAVLVLVYSGLAAGHDPRFALVAADRALELAIATVVVGAFLFARYYDVQVRAVEYSLALGFCFYSSFNVLNATILEHYLRRYEALWNPLGMFVFLVALLVWTWALRRRQTAIPKQDLLSRGVYESTMPEISLHLRMLDDRLSQLLNLGPTGDLGPRSDHQA